jgi:hypothetical protein
MQQRDTYTRHKVIDTIISDLVFAHILQPCDVAECMSIYETYNDDMLCRELISARVILMQYLSNCWCLN